MEKMKKNNNKLNQRQYIMIVNNQSSYVKLKGKGKKITFEELRQLVEKNNKGGLFRCQK
mgnify:FL=1